MKTYKFLNTDYVAKFYKGGNFDNDNYENYDNTLANLSKSGDLSIMKPHQLNILIDELDDYFYGTSRSNKELIKINKCFMMFMDIIEDIEIYCTKN